MNHKKILKEEIDPLIDILMSLGMNETVANSLIKHLTVILSTILGILVPTGIAYTLGTYLLSKIEDSDLPKNKIKRFFVDFILFNYKFYSNKKYKQSVINVKNQLIDKVIDPKIKEEIKNSIILFDNLGLYSYLEGMKGLYVKTNKIIVMNMKSLKETSEFENTLYHELIHYFDFNSKSTPEFGVVLRVAVDSRLTLILRDIDKYQENLKKLVREYRIKHNIKNKKEEEMLNEIVNNNFNDFFKNRFYYVKEVELTARFLSFKRDLKKFSGNGKLTKKNIYDYFFSGSWRHEYDYTLLMYVLMSFCNDNDWKEFDILLYKIYKDRIDLKN